MTVSTNGIGPCIKRVGAQQRPYKDITAELSNVNDQAPLKCCGPKVFKHFHQARKITVDKKIGRNPISAGSIVKMVSRSILLRFCKIEGREGRSVENAMHK
jgi:hypothetical protein